MIYFCEDCFFLFLRNSEINQCPNCEKHNIRIATTQEEETLLQMLQQKNTNPKEDEV